ncbi:MAG: hypothetical protein IKJ88_00595 [Clostridia bacterium]|nr:hypothetical protein [Clostridia bacterium]
MLHKRFLRTLALIIVLALSVTSCSTDSSVSSFFSSNREIKTGVSSISLHSSALKDYTFVAASGLVELYFDTRTTSVAVYDTSAQFMWYALPAYSNDSSAIVNLKLSNSDEIYYLNSQDNSVAYSSYSTEFTSNTIKVTYYMSDSEQTVNKAVSVLDKGEVYAIVPVLYTLEDGNLTVSIDCEEMFISDGFVLESLSVLPYFGAISYSAEALAMEKTEEETAFEETTIEDGKTEDVPAVSDDLTEDFILVPDGCGAVMYTAMQDETTESLEFEVYGNENNTAQREAVIGAYGIKKADAAFVAVVENGEAIATIKANRDTANADKVNNVYADFAINPSFETSSRLYYSDKFDGEISVRYRFMSGSEANYISMAASCREALIRNGTLSSKSVSSNELGLNISLIGSVDGSSSKKMTDFEGAQDILSVLKAKGINNVNLIFNAMFSGGLNQQKASSAKILKTLGGNSGFEQLCEYAKKQRFNVFAGVNILTASDLSSSEKAKGLDGNKIKYSVSNPLAQQSGKSVYTLNVLAADYVEQNIIDLMNSTKNLDFAGFCINDAANLLYGDASFDSTDVMKLLSENISALATQNRLMLSGANFYALKSASMLVDVPFYTQYAPTEAYNAVPFVMAILHSTVEYSGKAANICSVPKLEMLKCIEYGGVPHFMLVYDSSSQLYYANSVNEIVDFVLRANKDLTDLTSARITAHYSVEDGLFCTSYDNGAVVYVNYNNYSVTIGEISVMPYDYLRIN